LYSAIPERGDCPGTIMANTVEGLLLCWYYNVKSPVPKPNKITDDEVKN
jgi:hypothetical protein